MRDNTTKKEVDQKQWPMSRFLAALRRHFSWARLARRMRHHEEEHPFECPTADVTRGLRRLREAAAADGMLVPVPPAPRQGSENHSDAHQTMYAMAPMVLAIGVSESSAERWVKTVSVSGLAVALAWIAITALIPFAAGGRPPPVASSAADLSSSALMRYGRQMISGERFQPAAIKSIQWIKEKKATKWKAKIEGVVDRELVDSYQLEEDGIWLLTRTKDTRPWLLTTTPALLRDNGEWSITIRVSQGATSRRDLWVTAGVADKYLQTRLQEALSQTGERPWVTNVPSHVESRAVNVHDAAAVALFFPFWGGLASSGRRSPTLGAPPPHDEGTARPGPPSNVR